MLFMEIFIFDKRKILTTFESIQQVPHKVPLLEGNNTQKQYPIKPSMVSHVIEKA